MIEEVQGMEGWEKTSDPEEVHATFPGALTKLSELVGDKQVNGYLLIAITGANETEERLDCDVIQLGGGPAELLFHVSGTVHKIYAERMAESAARRIVEELGLADMFKPE